MGPSVGAGWTRLALWESPPAPSFPPGLQRVHPGSLRLATERVCPKGDTQFTLGSLSMYCLLILSVPGLCCCGGVSGYVSGATPLLRSPDARRLQHWSVCGTWAPGRAWSSHCGSQTHLLLGAWGPPGSQIEPVSPALAGRLFTTRETPYRGSLHNDIFLISFTSVALTVTSNARVSLHTDSVSGETTPVSSDEEEGHEGSRGGSGKSLGSNCSKQGPTLTHSFNYLNDIVFLRRDGGHCAHQRRRV